MAKTNRPTSEEWTFLYQAALNFKRSACWEWMYDDDIFGVVDPETGETAYCCVLGNAGEHFALAGYLGAEGLNGILGLLSGDIEPDDSESMFLQKCLSCSYEDRSTLAARDLKIIKELGLKFRGRKNWPLFRHHESGYFPWFLNGAQCRFLTHILTQALEVSLRCRNGKEILDHETPFTFLTRVSQRSDDGGAKWVDQYMTVEFPKMEFVSFSIRDEIRLRRIKSSKLDRRLILEADTFYAPSPIKENGRPYYPKVCVFTNHENGLAISFEMFKDIRIEGHNCIEMLVSFIEENGFMPSKLLVAREETYYLFYDVCQQLKLPLEIVDHLEFSEQVRAGMFEFMSR